MLDFGVIVFVFRYFFDCFFSCGGVADFGVFGGDFFFYLEFDAFYSFPSFIFGFCLGTSSFY